MSMFGKMSVGVRAMVRGPIPRIRRARTTNVYGLFSAMRTIHMRTFILTHGQTRLAGGTGLSTDVTDRHRLSRLPDGSSDMMVRPRLHVSDATSAAAAHARAVDIDGRPRPRSRRLSLFALQRLSRRAAHAGRYPWARRGDRGSHRRGVGGSVRPAGRRAQ